MEIKKEYCGLNSSDESLIKKPVLKGEIPGLDTFIFNIPEGNNFHFVPSDASITIFLFTSGKGKIMQENRQFIAEEIAVFVPVSSEEVTICPLAGNLKMLEIVVHLSENDKQDIKNHQNLLPYFTTYAKCKKYREAIKSEKTVNRMLLPENIVPRFCMGSVETTGPDKVDKHAHPMLEQLFFGLEKNDCIVTGNETQTLFKENVLLHVPLASEHGVLVNDGKMLNYIWMDFFRSQKEMKYITESHIMDGD